MSGALVRPVPDADASQLIARLVMHACGPGANQAAKMEEKLSLIRQYADMLIYHVRHPLGSFKRVGTYTLIFQESTALKEVRGDHPIIVYTGGQVG